MFDCREPFKTKSDMARYANAQKQIADLQQQIKLDPANEWHYAYNVLSIMHYLL